MSPRSDFDTPTTIARRAYEAALLEELQQHAERAPQPPPSALVTDLWAHARQHSDDGNLAARWVRHVIDLGWRPMDGAR